MPTGITSPYRFRECLKILKQMITSGQLALPAPNDTGYHSDSEAQTRGRPRQREIRAPPQGRKQQKDVQVLKVHGDTQPQSQPRIYRE